MDVGDGSCHLLGGVRQQIPSDHGIDERGFPGAELSYHRDLKRFFGCGQLDIVQGVRKEGVLLYGV